MPWIKEKKRRNHKYWQSSPFLTILGGLVLCLRGLLPVVRSERWTIELRLGQMAPQKKMRWRLGVGGMGHDSSECAASKGRVGWGGRRAEGQLSHEVELGKRGVKGFLGSPLRMGPRSTFTPFLDPTLPSTSALHVSLENVGQDLNALPGVWFIFLLDGTQTVGAQLPPAHGVWEPTLKSVPVLSWQNGNLKTAFKKFWIF